VDIRELDTAWYRHHLAMVPQEPIVLDTTVAENIAYGRPEATREEIQRAARMAELTPVLDRLEGGLDALLGDRGAKLSVGEKQRLCIARAILADPKILILDEATSSLDTHSEALIQRALTRVMRGRTSFIVAHRLSTIVNADLIVVLDQGRVLEAGNHAQLMRLENGRYRHLYQTQTASQPKAEAV
jgi:ABC-type multidrug transport system fused ATPase/permease subunit